MSLKIAFVTYEYPPKTPIGGIGTYIYQIAHTLNERGNYVEIFSTTTEIRENYSINEDGIIVHRFATIAREIFRKQVGDKFAERNKIINFDIIETPEYGADCLILQETCQTPIHLKLHTPDFLVKELNNSHISLLSKLRFILGALSKLSLPKPYWRYSKSNDYEYKVTKKADFISSPSLDLARIVSEKWNIDRSAIKIMPYPFTPNQELLAINPDVQSFANPVITFIGKLEKRKGILGMIDVIPKVLKNHPNTIFRFIGRPLDSPDKNLDMWQFLSKKLDVYTDNLDFVGEITYDKLPHYLSEATICIFPSIWENFPNVCLEAMSAARCVVGSKNGGMAEMLHGDCGTLIDPMNPAEIANEVVELLNNPDKILVQGKNARNRVLKKYNKEVIGAAYERTTHNVIHNFKAQQG